MSNLTRLWRSEGRNSWWCASHNKTDTTSTQLHCATPLSLDRPCCCGPSPHVIGTGSSRISLPIQIHGNPLSNGTEHTCCRSFPLVEKRPVRQKKKKNHHRLCSHEWWRTSAKRIDELLIDCGQQEAPAPRAVGWTVWAHSPQQTIARYSSRAVSRVVQWCDLLAVLGCEACLESVNGLRCDEHDLPAWCI
jgi:hypothetical protein